MKQRMKYSLSDFYCTQCGNPTIPIQRKKGGLRAVGHLKKLFCLNCKKEVNCCEVSSIGQYTFEDFKVEFEYGNFDEEGNRKVTYKKLKELIENGKCSKQKNISDVRSSRLR